MPALGQVDPTGSYCAVPDDWLKKKLGIVYGFIFSLLFILNTITNLMN